MLLRENPWRRTFDQFVSGMGYLGLIIAVLLVSVAIGQNLNCCTEDYALDGMNCVTPTVVDNTTYYCVVVPTAAASSSCEVADSVDATQCSSCCEASDSSSSSVVGYHGTYFSAWSKCFLIQLSIDAFCSHLPLFSPYSFGISNICVVLLLLCAGIPDC